MNDRLQITNEMDEKLVRTLTQGVLNQSKQFVNFANLLSPVADISYQMQENVGYINIDYSFLSKVGLYADHVCVNAQTKYFHTEFDQGPTFIAVPF